MVSTIDHIEKALGDAYRKEIDQEENVWRSLPFFAATISFQIAALSQVLLRLPKEWTGVWWDAFAALIIGGFLIGIAIVFLAASIAPARFIYISNEPSLLLYARDLDDDERAAAAAGTTPLDALAVLKEALANQYAEATRRKRQINQRRALRRSVADLAIFASTGFNIFLVLRLILNYIPHAPRKVCHDGTPGEGPIGPRDATPQYAAAYACGH